MQFKNTSHLSDELIHRMIDFILQGGRLPRFIRVDVVQGKATASGRSWPAAPEESREGRTVYRGGRIYLRAAAGFYREDHSVWNYADYEKYPEAEKAAESYPWVRHEWDVERGHLPVTTHTALEETFTHLAREIRYIQQSTGVPLARDTVKVRHHNMGTSCRLTDVDASRFALQQLRRFRREFV